MHKYVVLLKGKSHLQIQGDFILFSHVLPFISEGVELIKNIREALN